MIYGGSVWRINILITLLSTTAPQRDCFFYSAEQCLGYEWFMNNVSCMGSCKKASVLILFIL